MDPFSGAMARGLPPVVTGPPAATARAAPPGAIYAEAQMPPMPSSVQAYLAQGAPGDEMHSAANYTITHVARPGEERTGVMSREIAFLETEGARHIKGNTMGRLVGIGALNRQLMGAEGEVFAGDHSADRLLAAYRCVGICSAEPPTAAELMNNPRTIPVTMHGGARAADVFMSLCGEVEGTASRYYILVTKVRVRTASTTRPGERVWREYWQFIPVTKTGVGVGGTLAPDRSAYTNTADPDRPFYIGKCIYFGTHSKVEYQAPKLMRPRDSDGILAQQMSVVCPEACDVRTRGQIAHLRVLNMQVNIRVVD